jgi:serine/threonine-protein kinase RsbW
MIKLSEAIEAQTAEMNNKMNSTSLKIVMSSDTRFLQMIEFTSATVLQMLKVDDDWKFKITMAIREAVINAIIHGNKNNSKKKVSISYNFDSSKLEVTVSDQGNGFDYSKLPDPTNNENLLKPFGRGIFFIRSFMDKVLFTIQPGKGLTITMIKYF